MHKKNIKISLRIIFTVIGLLCLSWNNSSYALCEYTIDFKIGSQAGDGEHGLAYTGMGQKSIENGRLKLEIGQENKEAKISIISQKPGGFGIGPYFPRTESLYEYAQIRIKMRANGSGFPQDPGYALRLRARTDKGELNIPVPITDMSGGAFKEYTLDLAGRPEWQNAANVQGISFLLYPSNTFSKLVLEIESIKFIPRVKRIVEDKLAQVDETKTEYLDKCVPALSKRGLTIKGLGDQIAQFKAMIAKAKEYHQTNDDEQAYAQITKAEELHNIFYPRINIGWELIDLKERIEGLNSVGEIYKKKGARKILDVKDVKNIKKSYENCVKSLAESGEITPKDIEALNTKVDEAYQKLDRLSPYGLPLRPGLSRTSFGRFGWLPADCREGLLVFNLTESPTVLSKDFDDNIKILLTSESFRKLLDPIVSEEKKDVNWVSYRKNVIFRTQDKTNEVVHWDYICSLLAPGILLKTDAENLLLGQSRRKTVAPTHVVIPSTNGCAATEITEEGIAPQMTENWLLFLWKDKEKHNPILLVFEKKPDSIKLAKSYASISNKGGLGHVGVVDYAGMMFFDARLIDEWLRSVPAGVIDKCRMISKVMTQYPVKCREYYGVDESKREILIRNEIEYYSIDDEWHTPHEDYAPLPPIISYFKDQKYPVAVKQAEVDFDVATKYGPYRAVRGDELEYSIPMPDFNHRCYLRAEGDESAEERRNRFINTGASFFDSPPSIFSAPSWNVSNLNPENRRLILEQEKIMLECQRILKYSSQYGITGGNPEAGKEHYFRGPGAHSTTVDRIEPYSGLNYIATGWTTKYKGRISTAPRTYGDLANGFGFFFEPCYYYAKYSGDWEYIKKCWPFIKKVFLVYGRVNDWANWAIDYEEVHANNYVDMGPDVLKGPVSFMKLALGVGDREAYLWGAYLASKQAVNRMTFFVLGNYMRKYSNMAQTGDYCLDLGVGEFGCDIKDYANMSWQDIVDGFNGKGDNNLKYLLFHNMWTGCESFLEDYDLCSQCVPDSLKKIVFTEVPRRMPDWWCDYNGNISRYATERAMLDESTEDLWLYFDEISSRPERTRPGTFNLFALLQGRDAPAYLIDWEPNKLWQGTYDYRTDLVRIEIDAAKDGIVKLKSYVKPGLVTDNGEVGIFAEPCEAKNAIPPCGKPQGFPWPSSGRLAKKGQKNTFWEYNAQWQELILKIQTPGLHRFEISYPGWQKPLRKSYPGIEKLRDTTGETHKMPPGPFNKGLTFYANFDDLDHPVVFAKGQNAIRVYHASERWGEVFADEGLKGRGLGSALKPGGQLAGCYGEHNVPIRDGAVSFWIKPEFGPEDMKKAMKEVEGAMKERGVPLSEWHCLNLRLLEALPVGPARNLHWLIWSYEIGEQCSFAHWITSWASASSVPLVQISTPYRKGEWTHLATSWTTAPDGKSLSLDLYKNGKPVGTRTAVCNNPKSLEQAQRLQEQGFPSILTMMGYYHYPHWIFHPADLAKRNSAGLPDLHCVIDEVRMFDRGLSAEEIKALYEFDKTEGDFGEDDSK